jgi:Lipase (class 3)
MPYTQQQTVFVLSMLSNLAISQTGTVGDLERYLAEHIDMHLAASKRDIGAWTRAWGPAVFQAPGSSVADNVMYAALSATTPPLCVVAIAGTNYNSIFDILIEDFFVSAQVPWGYGQPPAGASISAGAFAGLTILQVLKPGPGLPGANQGLAGFLRTVTTQPVQVITAGHSLGGALAPAVALWLLNTRSEWDPQTKSTIACEPTAGPTAGNAPFAQYYDQALGPGTTRLYNSLDIVPQAWNDRDLSRLPTLYQPAIPPDLLVYGLTEAARAAARGGLYTQVDVATPALTGTIDATIIDPRAWAFENYLAQAGYQHIDAYFTLLQVSIGGGAMATLTAGMGAPAAAAAAARLRAKLERRGLVPPGII